MRMNRSPLLPLSPTAPTQPMCRAMPAPGISFIPSRIVHPLSWVSDSDGVTRGATILRITGTTMVDGTGRGMDGDTIIRTIPVTILDTIITTTDRMVGTVAAALQRGHSVQAGPGELSGPRGTLVLDQWWGRRQEELISREAGRQVSA